MAIKDLIQQAKAEGATRRVYMDLSIEVDAQLEVLAKAMNKTKKGCLEALIENACKEFEAMEKETNKRAKKAKS